MKNHSWKMAFVLIASVFTSLGGIQTSSAQSLYDAPVAPDAALVRILWAAPTAAEPALVSVGSVQLPASLDDVKYRPITAGHYEFAIGDKPVVVDLAAQRFYSIVVNADLTASLIADQTNENPSKVTLTYYNLTSAPASLRLASGKATIFADVPAGQSASRAVNPLSVDLAVGSGPAQQTGSATLRAGTVVSIISVEGSPDLLISEGSIAQ